jgi:hypothetical protein
MREQYEALPNTSEVFRLVKPGGGFLPVGHRLPKPEWLEPSEDDVKEAARTGRRPGLSVWDTTLSSVEQACIWGKRTPSDQLAFSASVANIHGAALARSRAIDVVADPLDVNVEPQLSILNAEPEQASLAASAEGHALIEGIRRPDGTSKKDHRDFRAALIEVFKPFPHPR